MTKSLVITTAFPPQIGGIQTILYKISQNLPSDEVEVLAPSMAGDEIFDNTCLFKVHRSKFLNNTFICGVINILTTLFIHRYACISFKFLCASIPIIRRQKIKIIQCGHIQLGLTCFFIKKLFGIPYVIYTYAQEIMDAIEPVVFEGESVRVISKREVGNLTDLCSEHSVDTETVCRAFGIAALALLPEKAYDEAVRMVAPV